METLLTDTITIVRAAGKAIMKYYKAAYKVKHKTRDNPVTDADLAADKILREQLTELVPEAGWFSEETVDDLDRLMKKLVWIVDPLDGTKEFIKGIPEFAVSVALVELGRPQIGVILNPVTDELFYCEKDNGVFYNDEEVTVSSAQEVQGIRVDASRTEIENGEFEPFEELVQINPVGSIAYKLARVASGQADATWSRGPKNEWDICAGTHLVEEAGGRCVNLTDKLFTFNHHKPKVSGVVADNGVIHDDLMVALAPHRSTART